MNPFMTIGYESPELFCDREKETAAIIQGIINNRAINLTSIRRIGKTALIRNVFYHLDKKKYSPIYIDLEGTDSVQGFISRFSSTISSRLNELDQNWLTSFTKWAMGFGASVTLDPISGMPKLDLSHEHKLKIESLDSLLRSLNAHQSKVFVLAIDEFQEVTKYEDKNTEGWLRSIMQEYPQIRFLFAGSEKTLMENIFNEPSRPFYQITQPMNIGYIPRDAYKTFILEKLQKWKQIGADDIDQVLDWCRSHTYYVQYFCNLLYEKLTLGQFESLAHIKSEILESHKHFFLSQKNLITNVQWQVLKSVAKREPVTNITSTSFLKFCGLAPTSVRRSVETLLEKDLLLKEEDGIKIYNVFLGRFLQTME